MDHVNERLVRLKHLLGIVEEEQDGLLSTALQAVEDQVLNYLGREELPPELERALLLMTASYWKGAAWAAEPQRGRWPLSSGETCPPPLP